MVQVFQNRSADLTGNILTRCITPRAGIGRGFAAFLAVQRRMGIAVPVFVEHVVAHDKTHGGVYTFVIDEHAFLVMGCAQFQGLTHPGTDQGVEAVGFHLLGNLGPFSPTEPPADKHWQVVCGLQQGLVVGDGTFGKPFPVKGVLLWRGVLQFAVLEPYVALARQVGLASKTGQI